MQIKVQPDADVLSSRVGSNKVCLVNSGCSTGVALDPSSPYLFRACS